MIISWQLWHHHLILSTYEFHFNLLQDIMLSPLHTKCFVCPRTQTRPSIHRTSMLRDAMGVKPLGSQLSSTALFPEGKRWPTHTRPFHCLSLWSKPRNATSVFWQARWPHELYTKQVFTMCQDGKGYLSETELSQRPIIHTRVRHTDSRMRKQIKTLQLLASRIKTLNHVIIDFESH